MTTMRMPKKKGGGGMSLWANTPDQHAFVMCGTQTLFLVHLTMFHMEEHCYQLVLRARLPEKAMRRYVTHRRKHRDKCYFLGNVKTDGMEIPDFPTGRRVAFIGDIFCDIPKKKHYHEWPWARAKPIVHNVLVTVERVVYYRHFDFNLEYPKNLTYLLFGAGDEAFLDHYQTREPDFDQVVALAEAPRWLPKPLLEAGIDVNFPRFQTIPTPCSPPLARGTHQVQYGEKPRRRIRVARTYWYSTKIVNATDPCECAHLGP